VTNAVGNLNYLRFTPQSAPGPSEVVIYAADVPSGSRFGSWSVAGDATAAAGLKLTTPNNGFETLNSALTTPAHYFEVTFNASAGTRYRLWLRLKAQNSDKYNDSVWAQFNDSVDQSGNAIYRTGTTAGLNVNMATCSTCVPAGWGWQNKAYWLPDTGEVWFAASGLHTMRIQVREDGVELDQIVLSPVTYVDQAPGSVTNDATIVPKP